MKKILCIILSLLFMSSIMVGCTKSGDESSEEGTSSEDSSSKVGVTIEIDGKKIKANVSNSQALGNSVVLYDRNYKTNDAYMLTVGEAQNDRTIITIKKTGSPDDGYSYSVLSVDDSDDDKSNVSIPVNGFLLSVKKDLLADIKIKKNTKVSVDGYADEPLYERMDLASAVLDDKPKSRKINMLYPADSKVEDGKIYFVEKTKTVTVPQNAFAVTLKGGTANNYTIVSTAEKGSQLKDVNALLFVGDYNVTFAKKYFTAEKKIFVAHFELLNDLTDTSSVLIGDKLFKINDENVNSKSDADGVYLYNCNSESLVSSNKKNGFIDIVILNDKVIYIGKENIRTLIPTSGGYTLTFAGAENLKYAKTLKIGDKVKSIFITVPKMPDMYLQVLSEKFPFKFSNIARTLEAPIVLYSSSYGKTTGTLDGVEIIINDNKVLSVNLKGNSEIPKGGYVLSISNENELAKKAEKIVSDTPVKLSVAGGDYGYEAFAFTKINGIRNTDDMIIYKDLKFTGTNPYGYEIVVGADGIMISESFSGNSEIPVGGFVISGHGVSSILLESYYNLGMKVTYDTATKKITVFKTPDLKLTTATYLLEKNKTALENAKKQFYSINYKNIYAEIETIESNYNEAKKMFDNGEIGASVPLVLDVSDALSKFSLKMLESSSVENRASWYRSNEKNDDEVRATLQKVKALNINALYIETWYNGQFIGFSSNPLIQHTSYVHGDYDVLDGFCRISKEFDIEIHAWVENFFIGTPGGTLVDQTKQYHCLDRSGKNVYPNGYGDFVFLDPYTKFSRDLVLNLYKEMLQKYKIDGLHLDYIRFSEPNPNGNDFGYNDDIIKGFQSKYKTSIDPHIITATHPLWKDWCKFREEIINSFVKEVYDMVQDVNPEIHISSACYPEFQKMPVWNFQNYRDWVDKGYMDEIFSMSYGADVAYPVNNAKDFITAIGGRCFYSIGVCAFDKTQSDILLQQMFQAKQAGASGENAFSWGSLIIHKYNYYDALKSGLYSKPSVQLYKYSKTVSAGMQRLISDLSEIYEYLAPEYKNAYSEIKSRADEILKNANSFEVDNATADQKRAYCKSASKQLLDFNEYIKNESKITNDNLKNALTSDITVLINALKTSIVRLEH